MKKILFIDSWTQSHRFINPVITSFKNDGNTCVLLHCDSLFLNSKYGVLDPVYSSNYEGVDLKEFNYSFDRAISSINPDFILFISIHGIIQRWGNFVASKKNIKTYLFMHGIREDNPIKIKSSFQVNIIKVFFYTKIFFFLLKDFLRLNKLNLKNIIFMVKYYIELIFFNTRYTNNPKINLGFNYDSIFVNIKRDIKYFKNNYYIKDSSSFLISGNVSALSSALKSKDIICEENQLLFVSQPEIYTKKNMKAILLKLKIISSSLELKLIFRPHPRDVDNVIIAKDLDIKISSVSEEFDFAQTKIAVGLNSAMMIGFMHLNKHIIQIFDKNNLNISKQFDYDNISILNINNLDSFNFNYKFDNLSKTEIFNPADIIKNHILYGNEN